MLEVGCRNMHCLVVFSWIIKSSCPHFATWEPKKPQNILSAPYTICALIKYYSLVQGKEPNKKVQTKRIVKSSVSGLKLLNTGSATCQHCACLWVYPSIPRWKRKLATSSFLAFTLPAKVHLLVSHPQKERILSTCHSWWGRLYCFLWTEATALKFIYRPRGETHQAHLFP